MVIEPVKHYEKDNLKFLTTNLEEFATDERFDLIRCMNVFMYFDRSYIFKNIKHAKLLLSNSGMFICGNVMEIGYASRYVVYKKHGTKLIPKLFGMDLGKLNQRDGNGWWGFYKDQPEPLFLAKIVRMVAENRKLFGRIMDISDHIEHELGLSYRDKDGHLHEKGFLHTTIDNHRLSKAIADECGDEITAFFVSMGIYAELTPFAHMVIDFSRSRKEHYEPYFTTL
jgi:hypothetical protein